MYIVYKIAKCLQSKIVCWIQYTKFDSVKRHIIIQKNYALELSFFSGGLRATKALDMLAFLNTCSNYDCCNRIMKVDLHFPSTRHVSLEAKDLICKV